MARPRIYGQAARYNPATWRRPRRRYMRYPTRSPVKATPKPVAGQIAKEKEGDK